MSLLSYTSESNTDCVKFFIEALKRKRLNGMTALYKFLVLLAIFLLASYANAFLGVNQVAGDQVQVNNFI
jgi:hypothetical protein